MFGISARYASHHTGCSGVLLTFGERLEGVKISVEYFRQL